MLSREEEFFLVLLRGGVDIFRAVIDSGDRGGGEEPVGSILDLGLGGAGDREEGPLGEILPLGALHPFLELPAPSILLHIGAAEGAESHGIRQAFTIDGSQRCVREEHRHGAAFLAGPGAGHVQLGGDNPVAVVDGISGHEPVVGRHSHTHDDRHDDRHRKELY